MSRGRRLAGLSLSVALLASAAACTSSGGGATSSSSSERAGATAAKGGGTLRIGIEKVTSLDPADASPGSQSQMLVADLLFDGLTQSPPGGGDPQPAIASSWQASADLKTWTFTLRSGATFSNGRAITADDVKYSLERVAKQGESTLPGIRLEVITGYHDFVDGAQPGIAGIKSVSPSTVEVDLDNPFAMLPSLLAAPSYGIVPKEAVEAPSTSPSFKTAPVTSGPFSYAGTATDDVPVVKLVRARADSAHLDGIELHEYDTLDSSYTAFVASKVDYSLVPSAKANEARADFGDAAFRPFHAELFYAFNVLDPTFGDVRFRQAIIQAINAGSIVKAVYPGAAEELEGVVPDGVPAHVADACGKPCAYDPTAARALVDQVFPSSPVPTVSIDYDDSADSAAVAGAIEVALNGIGIPTAKRPHAAADYPAFAVSGQQQLFQLGAIGLYDDADAYLTPLFSTGSRDNATGTTNDTFDNLMKQARATADATARVQLEQQAEQQVMQLAVIVPIAQFTTRAVVSPRVHDLSLGLSGTFDGSAVWLG